MIDFLLVEYWLQARDEASFRMLYRRHAEVVWRLALRLCRADAALAEEIAQEAWLRAVRGLPDYRRESSFRTWVCGILVMCWREELRRKNYQNRLTETVAADTPPPWTDTEPSTALDLEKAFEQLPEGMRETLILHDLEGFRHREIADILGIAEGTSKSRVSDGRVLLRRWLTGP